MNRHRITSSKDLCGLLCVRFGLACLILVHSLSVEAQNTGSKGPTVSPVLSNQERPKSDWTETDSFSFKGCQHIFFLLDCSFSMSNKYRTKADPKKARTRLEVAKLLIEKVLASLPKDASCGLRIFGAKLSEVKTDLVDDHNPQLNSANFFPEIACRETELVVPIHEGNRKLILKALEHIEARGQMTNLEYALRQTYDYDCADTKGRIAIILITDGHDSCGGNPAQFIAHTDPNRQISLVVASFASRKDSSAVGQLTGMIRNGSGKYFDRSEFGLLVDGAKEACRKD